MLIFKKYNPWYTFKNEFQLKIINQKLKNKNKPNNLPINKGKDNLNNLNNKNNIDNIN